MRRHATIATLLLASLVYVLADDARASVPRGIVYSKTTTEEPPEGTAGPEIVSGGLFRLRHRYLERLTRVPGDAEPSVALDGERIAFVRAGDVWAMRFDGSEQRQLTSGPEVDGRPLFSRDGQLVVFARRAGDDAPRDLYAIDVEGGSPRALTATPEDEREAEVAPDGKAIVFVRDLAAADGGTNAELYSVRPTGIGLRRLTSTPEDELRPHYFVGGIVFDRRKTVAGGYADVFAMRRNGAGVGVAVARGRGATIRAVSPNGRLLLFSDYHGLWAKRLSPMARQSIPARKLGIGGASSLVFSPDGRRFAYLFYFDEQISLDSIDVLSGERTIEGEVHNLESGTSIDPRIAW